MDTITKNLVPRSVRTGLAFSAAAQKKQLGFFEECASTAIAFSPWFILRCTSGLFVPLVGKALFVGIAFAIFCLSFMLRSTLKKYVVEKRYAAACLPLLTENTDDYLRAEDLRQNLECLTKLAPSLLSTSEPYLDGEWKPVCFEPKLQEWVRQELRQYFSDDECPLKSIFVEHAPTILDNSSLIFLKGSKQELLRVLMPFPSATEELFESAIEVWVSYTPENTHIRSVVDDFSLPEEILKNISHPEKLNAISNACHKPRRERPTIRIKGVMVKEGVAIATALNMSGEEILLFPSDFFEELHKTMEVLEELDKKKEDDTAAA